MFDVVVNCLLYLILLLTYSMKKKGLDFYKIIVSLFFMTSVLCLLNYAQNPLSYPTLSLFPFLFMFIVLTILFQPLRGFDQDKKVLGLYDNKALVIFAWIYVALALIEVTMSLNDTITRFQEGDWGLLRNQLYADEENIELYENQWQRLVKNLLSYTGPFAMVYAFYSLTQSGKRRLLTFMLFFSLVVPDFIAATVVASRGHVFALVLRLFMGYWMFRNFIPQKRKRFFWVLGIVLGVLFLIYSIIVSVSRFGEDNAGNSIFEYFGHSMLTFNNDMFYKMHDFAYGRRFFGWFIDAFGGNSYFDFAKAGSTHGTAFYTIVGDIFVDWGYYLTIPVAIIACLIGSYFTRKKTLRFSDFIVIFFYINTLTMGLFSFHGGRALAWVMTFVLYFLVRAIEPNPKKNKNQSTLYNQG